jgi:hypothetical protein
MKWGGETRSISDDFGDEIDTTFVPCILLFSPKVRSCFFVKAMKGRNISIIGAYVSSFQGVTSKNRISQSVALGSC